MILLQCKLLYAAAAAGKNADKGCVAANDTISKNYDNAKY